MRRASRKCLTFGQFTTLEAAEAWFTFVQDLHIMGSDHLPGVVHVVRGASEKCLTLGQLTTLEAAVGRHRMRTWHCPVHKPDNTRIRSLDSVTSFLDHITLGEQELRQLWTTVTLVHILAERPYDPKSIRLHHHGSCNEKVSQTLHAAAKESIAELMSKVSCKISLPSAHV